MWEFSLKLDGSFLELYSYIYNRLNLLIKNYGGVITEQKQSDEHIITLACEDFDRNRVNFYVADCLTDAICVKYKQIYLEKRLNISQSNDLILIALKNALIGFDKETDKFIVNKYLKLSRTLNINSFFNFNLQCLREKWNELIRIANENCGVMVSSDTYIELIKFLVDNLEIVSSTINVVANDGQYNIYSEDFGEIELSDESNIYSSDGAIISNLIDLSPKKIVMYCDDTQNSLCNLIKQIFYKRVTFLPTNLIKNTN